jgi:hypothetical protein
MPKARVLLPSVAALIVFLAQAHGGEPRPEITLSVVPAIVKLSPLETREARVVIENPTSAPLRELRLSTFGDADVQVDVAPPPSDGLAPHGQLVWTLGLTKRVRGSAAGQVHVQLDYRWQAETTGETVPGVALAVINIEDRQPDLLDKVAAVRIETTLDLLHEKRQGSIYLVVRNLSVDPITVKRMKMAKPPFIVVEAPPVDAQGVISLPQEITLGPQESRALPIIVTASHTVQPGRHLLLFEVDLGLVQYGYTWTETVIATQAFTVGVLGESEILTAIGVPSFLLLPGFLIVVAFRMLWTRVSPQQPMDIDPKSAEFWLIAILLSLGATFVYPLLTRWLGSPRNYIEGYGLRDIVNVWFGSVGVGFVFWAFWVGTSELKTRVRAQKIPSPDDGPLEILRKLARNRRGIGLEQVDITLASQSQRAFVILPAKTGQTAMWVAPSMTITWAHDPGPENPLDKWIEDRTAANIMADFIERQIGKAIEGISWDQIGSLRGPMQVEESQVKKLPGVRRIINQRVKGEPP